MEAQTTGAPNQATPQSQPAQGSTASQGVDRQAGGDPTKRPGATATAAIGVASENSVKAAAEAKRKLKIDDQEIDEDEVIKTYKERKGHQRAANKELQEGKAAKKQAEEFIAMMKDQGQLINVLEKIGYKKEDLRKLSETYLAGMLEEELLDPREKELRDTKNKLKTYEELEKQQRLEAKKRHDLEMKKKFADDYSVQFVEALKKTGLPPTKPMVAEMAKYIHRAAKIGFEMKPDEAAQLVREDEETRFRHRFDESDAESLVKLLGESGLKKIREYDTSRLKDPNAQLKTPIDQKEIVRKPAAQNRNPMTPAEWREYNRK